VLCGLEAVLVRVWSASFIVRRRARIASLLQHRNFACSSTLGMLSSLKAGHARHRLEVAPLLSFPLTPDTLHPAMPRSLAFVPLSLSSTMYFPRRTYLDTLDLPSVAVCSGSAAIRLGASSGNVAVASWDDKYCEDPRISYQFVLGSTRPFHPKSDHNIEWRQERAVLRAVGSKSHV